MHYLKSPYPSIYEILTTTFQIMD